MMPVATTDDLVALHDRCVAGMADLKGALYGTRRFIPWDAQPSVFEQIARIGEEPPAPPRVATAAQVSAGGAMETILRQVLPDASSTVGYLVTYLGFVSGLGALSVTVGDTARRMTPSDATVAHVSREAVIGVVSGLGEVGVRGAASASEVPGQVIELASILGELVDALGEMPPAELAGFVGSLAVGTVHALAARAKRVTAAWDDARVAMGDARQAEATRMMIVTTAELLGLIWEVGNLIESSAAVAQQTRRAGRSIAARARRLREVVSTEARLGGSAARARAELTGAAGDAERALVRSAEPQGTPHGLHDGPPGGHIDEPLAHVGHPPDELPGGLPPKRRRRRGKRKPAVAKAMRRLEEGARLYLERLEALGLDLDDPYTLETAAKIVATHRRGGDAELAAAERLMAEASAAGHQRTFRFLKPRHGVKTPDLQDSSSLLCVEVKEIESGHPYFSPGQGRSKFNTGQISRERPGSIVILAPHAEIGEHSISGWTDELRHSFLTRGKAPPGVMSVEVRVGKPTSYLLFEPPWEKVREVPVSEEALAIIRKGVTP